MKILNSLLISKDSFDLISMAPIFQLNVWTAPSALYSPSKNSIKITGLVHYFFDHEIAHIVEFSDNSRLFKDDFGFKLGRTSNNANIFFKALSKEIRVRAIQLHLIEKESEGQSNFYWWHSIKNDMRWMTKAQKFLPFGRFKTYEDLLDWEQTIRMKTYNNWNLDRIRTEWIKKINVLRNWMESN